MTVINPGSPVVSNQIDPALCNTQVFYDREVEFILCCEDSPCRYKKYYNKMFICECPRDKNLKTSKQ